MCIASGIATSLVTVTLAHDEFNLDALVHAAMATATVWRPNVEALSEHFRVYAVDVVGQGGKTVANRKIESRRDYADWLNDLFDGLGIARGSVVGNSYGGFIALNQAAMAPERIDRVVLIGPAGCFVSIMPVFRSMIDQALKGMLLRVLVWLMTLALRGNRAHVRHRLWLAAPVKFLVPFSWFVSLGAQLEWRKATSIAQPAATFVMEEILAPPVIAAVASTPAAHPTSAWPWMLASIWVVGFAGVLFWWWRQWRLVRAALDQAKPIALGSAYEVADLTVMSSAWTFEPGVIGIWHPVLLLPEGLADRLTPAQLNTVIAHERCHIGRHDNLAAAVYMVVEAIFWFHPLVWWIERRMLDERERACDEAVLSAGNDPDEYVAGILSVCRFTLRAPLACVAGVSGAELRSRIESIVRMELGTRMTVTRRVAVGLVAAVLLGVPIVADLVRTPVVVAAFAPPAGPVPLLQIQDPPRQSFEVASVKPNKSGETTSFLQPRPGGNFAVGNMTLRGLIMFAYGIQGFQLVGAPDWVATERFDITAKAAADVPPTPIGPTSPEALMLRSLLEDRFRLS